MFANSQYRSTHFLAWPSISWDYEEILRFSQHGSFFSSSRGNSGFKHGSVIVNNIFAYFTLSLSTSQIYMIKERCWFSQINFFEYFPHRSIFCFFPANLMSSTYTDKNNPFHGVRISIPNWKPSPNLTQIEFSQVAFHITVLPKDDHTHFAQEERLGLPYWTMILAVCVVVDESKCLDIPILEFSIILAHLPCLLGYKPILRLLLVHRNPSIWRWFPWSWRLSFEMLKILVQWILRKTQSCLLQYHRGIHIAPEYNSTFVFLVPLPPIRRSSNDRCPSVRQNEPLRPSSLLHRSPLIYFWLLSGSTQESFSSFSHSLSTAAFAAGIFMAWTTRINLCTKL